MSRPADAALYRAGARNARQARIGRGLAALLGALFASGCVAMDTEQRPRASVAVIEQASHCPAPPEAAGAALLGRTDVGAHRIRLGMGQRSTGGYAVTLTDTEPVRVVDRVAVLRVEWRVPGADEAVTQALTRPCLEIHLPEGYRGVRFVDQDGVVRGTVRIDGER